jgi:2-(1,2-epoxy-1,2-dihydrophenyl)acetyl-CoA isomerase
VSTLRFLYPGAVDLRIDREDGIATILLNRPQVRNAITPDLLREMSEGLADLAGGETRAAVIAGDGGSFCSGADLQLVREALEGEMSAVLGPLVDNLHQVIRQMRQLPFPVIAAVEGPAAGAGVGLALAADLRVAGRAAVFVPGYFGIGASPDGGVSYFFTRLLGAGRATSLIMRNRPIRADMLLAEGLVEEVVDDGQVVEAALRLASEVASTPPLALLRLRSLVDLAPTHGIDAHLDAERQAISELWPSADFREGVTAFLERRKPVFRGR